LTRCGGYFFRRSVDFVDTNVRRGEIYYADLSPVVGSEQGGVRPVLIVQNDTGNRHSPTVIAAAITSQTGKAKLPTHIEVAAQCCGLPKDSVILLEQIRTLDKRRLRERMQTAKVHCQLEVWNDMWHVFQMFPVRKAALAMESIGNFLLEQ